MEIWNEWRQKDRQLIPDLSNADLGGADLSEADLGDATLRDADFGRADLTKADLGWATLASSAQAELLHDR